jgi:hypothetical protein
MGVMTFFQEKICNLLQISAGAALLASLLWPHAAYPDTVVNEWQYSKEVIYDEAGRLISARLQAGESLFSMPIRNESTDCVREGPQLIWILRDKSQPAQDNASPCH